MQLKHKERPQRRSKDAGVNPIQRGEPMTSIPESSTEGNAAQPCADCAGAFAVDLLDDEGLCMWCEAIRGGENPEFIADEKEAAAWLKANPGVNVTDEYIDSLEREEIVLIPVAEIKATIDAAPIVEADDSQGKIAEVQAKNAQGLLDALGHLKIEIRYNVRAHRVEARRGQYTKWRAMNDRTAAALREALAFHFFYKGADGRRLDLNFSADAWADAVNALCYTREVDPFIEWLEGLPAWDGQSRLAAWLMDVFQMAPSTLAAWAGRFMVMGPIARAYSPGSKLDEMPVLIGPPGCGKSTAIRCLLPLESPEWFSDGLDLAGNPKERAESLQGRVIVEASEMIGTSRADIESLKAFLSRTDDGAVRLSYRRDPEQMLRRCVIVGTADRQDPLPADRNTRRFVSILLDGGNPVKLREYLDANRAQLWAEGLHQHRQGQETRLPDTLKGLQEAVNATTRARDAILEDAVSEWATGRLPFTLAELAEGVGMARAGESAKLPTREIRRLTEALRGMDYGKDRTKVDGVLAVRWGPGE